MGEVRIRDTLSGELRTLDADGGEVGIYACGPTVYSRIHIGNARPFVVFSLLRRFLEAEGYAARLVVNVTDVNDKIYTAAEAAGKPSAEWAEEMTRAYVEDTDRLGVGRPDAEPLATETLPQIIDLIERLVADGRAYRAGGDVYFAVRGFPEYGRLSGQDPDRLLEGARVEPGEHKRDPLDFALWKAKKTDEDTSWESPWGLGRPGWHI